MKSVVSQRPACATVVASGSTRSVSRRGSAVALSLVCVTIVAGLAVAFLRVSTSASSRQLIEVENMQAFYLAEAGLAEAFQALRIGRSGQIGSETEPAVSGAGLLWVDAIDTADDQVRLESTALVGSGRATLALIVEPVDIPLGFFSDEDLLVESVLLVDGFDSDERTYEEELAAGGTVDIAGLKTYADWLQSEVGNGTFDKVVMDDDIIPGTDYSGKLGGLTHDELVELAEWQPALREGYPNGYDEAGPTDGTGVVSEASIARDPIDADPAAPIIQLPIEHTTSGGLLSSNGDIHFQISGEDSVAVYGDVVPGPEGSVTGLDNVSIFGETESRADPIELEEVDVPAIELANPTRHDDLLPLVISPGTSGWERIEVAPDAELVLRGPATIVIGELVLAPGATLTLDTRDGDVALYITDGMDLQPGSLTTTTGDFADELTVQVAPIASDETGAPVKLDSTSSFHGTIYAPRTDVYVGTNFEVHGSIVAKKLELGPGAKLHFDNAGFDGTPIPRLVAWRIVEIKSAARNRARNPFRALAVDPATLATLSESHDLASVQLTIEYLNLSGAAQSFTGTEDAFDWGQVKDVFAVSRDATREKETVEDESVGIDDGGEPEPEPARSDVMDAIELRSGPDLRMFLLDKLPLSETEVSAVLDAASMAERGTNTIVSGSAPLSIDVLEQILSEPSRLVAENITTIMLDHSPLPPELVDLLNDVSDLQISPTDRATILGAQ